MKNLFLLLYFNFLFLQLFSQPVISYQPVTNGLVRPVDIANAGDGSGYLYIVQQNGIIQRWDGSSLSVFLDVSTLITNPTGGEQGLLSMAFHPAYSSNGYFFIYYTNAAGDITLARYRRDAGNPAVADPASGAVLLNIPKPGTPYYQNHNGGKLNFGSDGMLYFGTGDGGGAGDPLNNAQNLTSLLGKMLRIDVSSFATSPPFYNIPAGNPFIGAGGGVREEIWSYGLRNPWRWSFDRLNGDMWIGDVGQGQWEEVDHVAASLSGFNFGWDCHEGNHLYAPANCSVSYTAPVFEYPHNSTTGGYSITGGYVYRGNEFPSLYGKYVTADYVSGNLWIIDPTGASYNSTLQSGLDASVSSFGEAEDGSLFAVRRLASNAPLLKVVVTSVVPVNLLSFQAFYNNGKTDLSWRTSSDQDVSHFTIQYSDNGRDFGDAGSVASSGDQYGKNYSFSHILPLTGRRYYRIGVNKYSGSMKYSEIRSVIGNGTIEIITGSAAGNNLQVLLNIPSVKYIIINSSGDVVSKGDLRGRSGIVSIDLPYLTPGIYVLVIYDGNETYYRRFIKSQ